MKNEFKWSVTRSLNPVEKNSERITKELKDQSERLDWSGLKFPVKLDQIVIFEKLNPQISINVFGFEDRVVYPLRLSKSESEQTINLLLISDGEKQHYCLIKSLSRLLSSQVSGHKESNSFCLNCLNHFPNEEKLKIHEEYCLKNQAIRIEMPEKGSFISFIHHNRFIKVPFVVYFEAFTEEISTCEPNDKKSFTQKYQRHRPSGFCYKIVCFDEQLYNQKPVLFRAESEDEDISAIFVEMLERDIKRIQEKFDFSKKMIFSPKDKDDFEKAEICWICQKEFGEREKKVRDHCHFTGKYRGAAHVKCNLQFKKTKFTPVIFHNLSGYDAHLFVKNLGRTEGNIKCIPNNAEKYISFSKDIVVGEYEKDGKNMK